MVNDNQCEPTIARSLLRSVAVLFRDKVTQFAALAVDIVSIVRDMELGLDDNRNSKQSIRVLMKHKANAFWEALRGYLHTSPKYAYNQKYQNWWRPIAQDRE
jgi:hypothetical protein